MIVTTIETLQETVIVSCAPYSKYSVIRSRRLGYNPWRSNVFLNLLLKRDSMLSVQENMDKALQLLRSSIRRGHIDLIVLPELAFTGYLFDDKDDIRELMESNDGPTFQWCTRVAAEFGCMVAAGYPLKTKDEKWYNAMCLVSKEGREVITYSKHFLYEPDYRWAEEGPGFVVADIPELGGKVGFGICMDVNPKDFVDSTLYEFAHFHKSSGTFLLIMLCNWVDADPEDKDDSAISTQAYWCSRLKPLLHERVKAVFCNRVGREKDTTFVGGSCVLNLETYPKSIVGCMKKREEGVLVVNVDRT
ncbi:hydrolase, carbon-nitrogen family protein [Planoprotostelium fungivorum]|uniref:Hydrolase, carbon-nitrogen family protein n=1 Tax=Planoprotostelium fungivorum TaxID=1890364 RepID=A0A2P6N000_9EUKA|nr:hydrolase, carbon-nitrogen family protein [Planoprotostelium fungivorum]